MKVNRKICVYRHYTLDKYLLSREFIDSAETSGFEKKVGTIIFAAVTAVHITILPIDLVVF